MENWNSFEHVHMKIKLLLKVISNNEIIEDWCYIQFLIYFTELQFLIEYYVNFGIYNENAFVVKELFFINAFYIYSFLYNICVIMRSYYFNHVNNFIDNIKSADQPYDFIYLLTIIISLYTILDYHQFLFCNERLSISTYNHQLINHVILPQSHLISQTVIKIT